MNAYELADINDWSCCAHVKEVSAMLRQQADRIAELQEINNRFADLIQSLREEVDKLRKESE